MELMRSGFRIHRFAFTSGGAMRSLQYLICLSMLSLPGCIFLKNSSNPNKDVKPPKFISKVPTEAELVSFLNHSDDPSKKIRSFEAESIWIDASAEGKRVPTVRGEMYCETPRNFRLQGKVAGFDQIDFGSNDKQFWFWIKESPDPKIFYCSYEDFERGVALPFPFQPEWVVEVLGMAEYGDPSNYKVVEKPQHFELVQETTLQGKPVKKIIVFSRLDSPFPKPQIVEHKVVDQQGRVLCTAQINRLGRDKKTGIIYPDKVVLEWPAEKLQMKLELGSVSINKGFKNAAQLFALPNYRQQVDLGKLQNRNTTTTNRLPPIQPVGSHYYRN
jgi:hypothetical protein